MSSGTKTREGVKAGLGSVSVCDSGLVRFRSAVPTLSALLALKSLICGLFCFLLGQCCGRCRMASVVEGCVDSSWLALSNRCTREQFETGNTR